MSGDSPVAVDPELFSNLCSYVPASIVTYLEAGLEAKTLEVATPSSDSPIANQVVPVKAPQSWDTVVLFADVSGFTKLCEAMAAKGPGGDEDLARHLNTYFDELVKIMCDFGGDVFKFAGDAVLVLWPASHESVKKKCRRAGQCALVIKERMNNVELAPNVVLNIKVGLGCGRVHVLHLGGTHGRREYIATGQALTQAFNAEHNAVVRIIPIRNHEICLMTLISVTAQ